MLEELNPLKCVYFDRLQAAVKLIKGRLSKYAMPIIVKNLALNNISAYFVFIRSAYFLMPGKTEIPRYQREKR